MWARIASFLVGVWLLAAPDVLGYGNPAAAGHRIAGPVAAAFAFVAIWEVTRGLRWANLLVALWLLAAPWLLAYPLVPLANGVAAGAALSVLAFVGGETEGRYGGGWSSLVRGNPGPYGPTMVGP